MADGTVRIDTSLDSSGFESGLSKLGGIAKTGLKTAMAVVGGVSTALGGLGLAAAKIGSGFEAEMSKVEAISGASGKDLEALTEKAKEMGAKTKFSASESAQALEYMAMAGWKTEDMLGGIEGIMNLAAASGEDLALTSDIVTDALTAFGLSAKDSGRFADIMAAASSNANTNVSMLGESFKYVAPVAGALGYSAEDTAVALGLMANSGIKASQGGTSLRSTLTRMAKPTKDVQRAMDDLGISLTDSEGNMKSLDDLMGDLREGFSGLTEAEKAQYAASLAGKEGMSGLLAIVSASDGDFNKLKDAVYGCDGAAQQMAETMQDNLSGSVTILKSSAEGLGIEIYEGMAEPLKNAADAATGYVNDLTAAFKGEGFRGLAATAGDIFADLVTKAAEQAPRMIDTAVTLIESFVKGLIKNKGRLARGAKEIVLALADGLVRLLPQGLQAPVRDAINGIVASFEDGGLGKAVDTVVTLFGNICNAAGKLAEFMLPPLTAALDLLGENFNLLVGAAAGAYAGLKVFNGLTSVTGTLGGIVGKVQGLWGLLTAHPFAALAGGIAAAAGGIAVLLASTEDAIEAQYGLTEEEKICIDTIHEMGDAYRETMEAREQSFSDTSAEFKYYEDLWQELQGIVDENGKINEGYEGRAAFITSTLSEALGTEIQIVDGVIQQYGNLRREIGQLIEVKKAEAYLSADEDAYAEAIRNKEAALQEYLDAQKAYTDAVRDHEEAVAAAEKAQEDWDDAAEKGMEFTAEESRILEDATKAKEKAEATMYKLGAAYEEAEGTYLGYVNVIEGHEGLAAAILTGDAEGIGTALLKMRNDFVYAETSTRETLLKQVQAMQENYQKLKKAVDDGAPGVTQAMVDEAQDMVFMAVSELERFDDLAEPEGQRGAESYAAGARAGKPSTAQAGRELLAEAMKPFQGADFTDFGPKHMLQYRGGVRSQKGSVAEATGDVMEGARVAADAVSFTATGKNKIDEAAAGMGRGQAGINQAAGSVLSGAKAAAGAVDFSPVGENAGAGVESGIRSKIKKVAAAAREMVQAAINSANNAQEARSPARKLIKSGRWFGEGAEIGIKDKTPDVAKAGGEMMQAAVDAADRKAAVSSMRAAMDSGVSRITSDLALRVWMPAGASGQAGGQTINQTVNINQPVKGPVETARELKKVGRELCFGR